MKRCILVLLLFCTPLLVIHALPRKKVAIVLSGGGAKGVAHIGALKVIEELGIPIDYVAGWKIQCKLPPKTKRFCPLVLK